MDVSVRNVWVMLMLITPRPAADEGGHQTGAQRWLNIVVEAVSHVNDLARWQRTFCDERFEELRVRLFGVPVIRGGDEIGWQVHRAEEYASAGGLVAGDADEVTLVLQCGQTRSSVGV